MKCKACGKELPSMQIRRALETKDERCYTCIGNDNSGILKIKDPDAKPEKEELPVAATPEYGFPEPGNQTPTPAVTTAVYHKTTPPRYKLSAHPTAGGLWQVDVTVEGPDYLIEKSNSDADIGNTVKEPLAAVAISMIHEMEKRLHEDGKPTVNDPKEPKPKKIPKSATIPKSKKTDTDKT